MYQAEDTLWGRWVFSSSRANGLYIFFQHFWPLPGEDGEGKEWGNWWRLNTSYVLSPKVTSLRPPLEDWKMKTSNKMYTFHKRCWGNSDKCTHLCNHHANQGIEYFDHPKDLLPLLISPHSQGDHSHTFYRHRLALLALKLAVIESLYQTLSFVFGIFHSTCFWEFPIRSDTAVHFFLLANSFPGYEYSIICLCIHLMMGIWIIYSFWYLWKKALMNIHKSFCRDDF